MNETCASGEGELFVDHIGQPVGDLLSLLGGGGLDHHADQRLGARRPQQHPAGVTELGLRLGHRGSQDEVLVRAALVDVGHVDQHLRKAGHHPGKLGQRRMGGGHPVQHVQGGEDAVAGGGVAAHDHVAGLLATEGEAGELHRLQDVAVPHLRLPYADPGSPHCLDEAEVAHHGGHDRVVVQRTGLTHRQREDGKDLVAVDDLPRCVDADLLAVPAGDRYPPLPDDPRQKRERIFATLVGQLEDLAQHRPVLFLFEDAHWSDSTSLELLDRIAERVRRLPVLMVVTFRPEFEPPWTGQAGVTSVTLSCFGQRETKALVGRVAGGKTLPVEILDRIIEHTDGIPLCIEELTRTLLEGNLLREEEGKYILSGPLPTLAIPSSLHDSLMARLDRLGPVKEVAQIGAAIGREFSYDIVKALAHRPDGSLREA